MNIDRRGHYKGSQLLERSLTAEINSEIRFLKTMKEKFGVESSPEDFNHPFHPSNPCGNCGEDIKFFTKDKGETLVAESECPYKDGFPPIEVTLEVPSGEILLFNDLREFYENEGKDPYFDINTNAGIKDYCEYIAKLGMVSHFVGNTCPDVVQVSPERLEIGNFRCEHEDGCKLPECPMPSCNRPTEIGSICTDLWWYCAVDRSEFEKRIGKTTEQYQKEYNDTGAWPQIVRAKVTPGTYKAVGQYHIDSDKLFSYIEKI